MTGALKDVPELPDELKDAARDGNLVLFIGAGVSMLAGYPSWNEFAHSALKDLCKKEKINYEELDQLKKLNDPKKQLSIAKIIAENAGIQLAFNNYVLRNENKSRIYDYINSINAVCVTTNYDHELQAKEQLLGRDELTPSSVNRISDPEKFTTVDLNKPGIIIHLHGDISDPSKMIVTTSDYLSHYENPDVNHLLERLFRKHTVLFIGSGFEEMEILEHVFRKTKNAPKRASKKGRFLLQPFLSNEKSSYELLQMYYKKSFDVDLIGYLRDKKDFFQLEDIMEIWATNLNVKDLHYLDKIDEMDEILSDE